jgi:hypothetical protein
MWKDLYPAGVRYTGIFLKKSQLGRQLSSTEEYLDMVDGQSDTEQLIGRKSVTPAALHTLSGGDCGRKLKLN